MVLTITFDEQTAWKKWTECRDAEAGNFLAKKYLTLVSYHVQRIAIGLPKNVSRDDLNSLGMMGLFDALEKFDPHRDLKFDTYASFRVRGAIIDGLRKEDWLPRSTREKAKKIEAVSEKLEQELMRKASSLEIADALGIPEDEVCSTINEHFYSNVLSMDEQPLDLDEKEGTSFALKDEKADNPEEKLIRKELLGNLASLIEKLNEKEQLVVSLFYYEELTLTEIGQVMSLSTSRISQIHSRALFKLNQFLAKIM